MMLRDLPAIAMTVNVTSTEYQHSFEDAWYPSQGVRDLGLMMDLQNIWTPGGTGSILAIPTIQFAAVRRDRPGVAVEVAGTARSAADVYRYVESFSARGDQAFFRRGIAAKLTGATTMARVNAILYASYRQMARIFPAEEVVVQPTNDNTLVSMFPLCGGRPIPAIGVDKVKLVIVGMGNDLASTMVLQPYVRFYNDPLARGVWSPIGSTLTPTTVNFGSNTGEISLTGFTVANFHWMDLAIGMSKSAGTASRCTLHVIPSDTYP